MDPTVKIDHLEALRKFVYRLPYESRPEERARLQSVVATYTRLYVEAGE